MTEALQLFLIEDDDDIALLIRKSLERAGHQVTRCRSAADALIVLGHTTFDLVLLDQRLPDMAGLDLLQVFAQEGIQVPALMVTAYGDEQLATQVLHAGALDYVVKDPALTFLTELPKRVSDSVTRHRLQLLNRLLIQALESARDGIMITDLQGTILHVNRALEHMTGYARDELIGQTPRLLKSSVHPAELYADLWRSILARSSWQGELTNRRKDGSLLEVSLTVSPIVNSQGRLTHFVGIQRDMTERRQLERQLLHAQKMQSVGTLAGGVAHEFNNLLAGINGYAALGLREAGLTPTVEQFLKHIVHLSERAAVLTRQLLAFARKPALTRRPTRMADLVRATAELVSRTLMTEVGLDVHEMASDEEPLTVEADANQLQQALVNLALNGRDALTKKGAEHLTAGSGPDRPITFRLRQALVTSERPGFPHNVPPGDYVQVQVADQGCGMAPEVLSQALDPFFTTKEVGQGTGLGLPVVFGIVQGHQGWLTIESAEGQGTTVSLYLQRQHLPAAQIPETAPLEVGHVLEPENVPGRSILVIDDEEAVREVIRRFLEIAGHHVTCVSRGSEAIELFRNGATFDLVIQDLMMPREDSVATFMQCQQRRPDIPILLCTGLPQAEPVPHLLQAGAAGLIRKPFRMTELWYAVKQALDTPPASERAPAESETIEPSE
jgi:PAS domain S-box-containing protein